MPNTTQYIGGYSSRHGSSIKIRNRNPLLGLLPPLLSPLSSMLRHDLLLYSSTSSWVIKSERYFKICPSCRMATFLLKGVRALRKSLKCFA